MTTPSSTTMQPINSLTHSSPWPAEKIKDAFQHGSKPVVVKVGQEFIDLTHDGLARIEGVHMVWELKYEIIVLGKGKPIRRGRGGFHRGSR